MGIKSVRTSVNAPNMNSFAERFVRSVRDEALNNFILLNETEIRNIVKEYIHYYNTMRPHQGKDDVPLAIFLRKKTKYQNYRFFPDFIIIITGKLLRIENGFNHNYFLPYL